MLECQVPNGRPENGGTGSPRAATRKFGWTLMIRPLSSGSSTTRPVKNFPSSRDISLFSKRLFSEDEEPPMNRCPNRCLVEIFNVVSFDFSTLLQVRLGSVTSYCEIFDFPCENSIKCGNDISLNAYNCRVQPPPAIAVSLDLFDSPLKKYLVPLISSAQSIERAPPAQAY